jgi:hypothetical protein
LLPLATTRRSYLEVAHDLDTYLLSRPLALRFRLPLALLI